MQLTQNTPQSNTFQPPTNLDQIKGIMNMARSGGNAQGLIQTLIQNSPQGNTILGALASHNGDAKAAFYDMAKQKGVDPNVIINMLK